MNTLVDQIEQKTTELIALCEMHKQLKAKYGELPTVADSEINRLWAQAQGQYTIACQTAVAAALALTEPPGTA
jgi:hypothetical protein